MRLVFGRDREVAHWVALRIPLLAEAVLEEPYGLVFGPSAAIGVENAQGLLCGGVVYHNYSPYFRSIELSAASEGRRWLTREITRALLRYPFESLECVRVTGLTPRKSDQSRRFLERLGFKREGVARFGFGADHAMIYGLLRSEWSKHPYNLPRAAPPGAAEVGKERTETANAA